MESSACCRLKEKLKREKGGTKKPLELPKRSDEKEDVGNDFAVAEVVKENGIVIHDDD